MRLSELKNAGRTPELPMSLSLADAAGTAELQLLTGAAGPALRRRGRMALVVRYWPNCWSATRPPGTFSVMLAGQGLKTPLLLADGLQEGEGGWLLFEFLQPAPSLGDAWAEVQGR